MRKFLIFYSILIVSILLTGNLWGQAVGGKTEVYEKTHIPKKEPVPYKFTREADVYWSKTIWRALDLKEKMNLPLYFPTEPMARPNLVKLITESIKNEGVKVYDTNGKVDFTAEVSLDKINSDLGAGLDSTQVNDVWKVFPKEAKYGEVTQLWIKELWFFNKQYSSMEVRIIGMCPVRITTKDNDTSGTLIKKPLYWVYYPDIRRILTQNFVFNAKNDAQNISFDDLFTQRRFSSYIYKESNAYNDRQITDYTAGMDVLYESDRIKESIMNWEHDLWEY
jgi:gliding motility associated protien GldN